MESTLSTLERLGRRFRSQHVSSIYLSCLLFFSIKQQQMRSIYFNILYLLHSVWYSITCFCVRSLWSKMFVWEVNWPNRSFRLMAIWSSLLFGCVMKNFFRKPTDRDLTCHGHIVVTFVRDYEMVPKCLWKDDWRVWTCRLGVSSIL